MTTAVASIILLPILKSKESQQRKNKLNQLIKNIQKDLDFTGEKLRDIAAKADHNSYSK